jgi:uncharacterized protein YjiS (DUF1127 family)
MTATTRRAEPARSNALTPERIGARAHLAGVVRRLLQERKRRIAARCAAICLHGLPEALLKDIGVDRSEIESVVQGCDRSRRRMTSP